MPLVMGNWYGFYYSMKFFLFHIYFDLVSDLRFDATKCWTWMHHHLPFYMKNCSIRNYIPFENLFNLNFNAIFSPVNCFKFIVFLMHVTENRGENHFFFSNERMTKKRRRRWNFNFQEQRLICYHVQRAVATQCVLFAVQECECANEIVLYKFGIGIHTTTCA